MLMHSFVLDALETTGADTFSHFEMLIDEHISMDESTTSTSTSANGCANTLTTTMTSSRLKQLVPTVGVFHTRLPLRKAFEEYNRKHRLTKRKHITISFNEIRQILNLAQVMALAGIESKTNESGPNKISKSAVTTSIPTSPVTTAAVSSATFTIHDNSTNEPQTLSTFVGPKLITFDGDQTLYSDGANFESNPQLAHFMHLLLKHGVTVAVVTAAGYEYNRERYEYRLSGLLAYFREMELPPHDCERFYLFGGECNYLLQVSTLVC